MTEIKIEPLDEDIDNLEIKKEIQEVVEVKDPLDIKLEPVVQDLPSLDDDEDLDVLDTIANDNDKNLDDKSIDSDISDNDDDNDKDFEPSEKSDEDIEVDIEQDSNDDDQAEQTTSIELNGMTIVQKGGYSKCPKCQKFIKSTFIIRHIKLHDAKEEKTVCPHENCNITFAKINNMFRHLRNVHKSKEPFVCKHCGKRFAKSKALASHLALHRAEKRKLQVRIVFENYFKKSHSKNMQIEFFF